MYLNWTSGGSPDVVHTDTICNLLQQQASLPVHGEDSHFSDDLIYTSVSGQREGALLQQLVCTTLGGRGGVCTTGSACVHHPGGEGRGMYHWVSLCAPPWGGGEGYAPLGQLVCTTLGGRGGVCTTGSACVHHPGGRGGICTTGSACVYHPGGEGRGMYHWVSLCAPPWGEGRGMYHWVSLCAPPWGRGEGYAPLGQLVCTTLGGRGMQRSHD